MFCSGVVVERSWRWHMGRKMRRSLCCAARYALTL